MKPQFALLLSFDGIRLLLRAAGGWQSVGAVDVSSPDLVTELAALRKTASDLRPQRVRTKLIIPDDQIRYLSIETGDLDDAARRQAASAALVGATPYPVDALSFDISADGTTTHIAAVARETLAEAEAFAIEHRFHPVSFVAAPEDKGFLGEPFFGITAHSKTLLPQGREVEPDGVRVVVTGPVDLTAAAKDAATDTEGANQPVADAPQKVAQPAAPGKTPRSDGKSDGEPQKGGTPQADNETAQPVAQGRAKPAAKETAPARQEPPQPAAKSDPAPPLTAAPADDNPDDSADDQDPTTEDPAETSSPHAAAVAALGFASRRGSPITAAAPLGGVTRDVASDGPRRPVNAQVPPPPITPPKATTDSLRPVAAPEITEPEETPAPASPAGFLSRRKPRKEPKPPAESRSAASAAMDPDLEAKRMTVFGARETEVGGKPRYLGLILIAILLVFLAGVAAWATVFLDDGLARLFQGRERTLASTLPDDTPAIIAEDVGATTITPEEAAEEGVDQGTQIAALGDAPEDALTPEDAAVLDALRDPLPDPLPDPQTDEALDIAALEARYAVTGIWPKAPEPTLPTEAISLDDLYITSIDPVSPALDAVALPSPASFQTDASLAVVTSPAAAGTNFALGPDGRVIPTETGALSPDGFTVFAGQPPVIPPATPVRFATDPTETGTLDGLTQVRPRARPVDLLEQNERATLGGLSRAELAGMRPRLRPASLQQETEAETATPDADAPISPYATAQSARPEPRPRNFNRIVALATRTPNAASTAAVTTASVAPRTVSPSIPSSASVSREATVRNAINLNRINLIGVYGKPSDRRALVRLSNGRYRKVQVGDRIDGGRVSAIGDGELRYQKGSRNMVLKMPKG